MADAQIDQAGIDELMHSEAMADLMQGYADDVAEIAFALAPKRTGKMASRIRATTEDGLTGIQGVVTAPAPANLLSTASGLRKQTRAWGRPVHLFHKADDAFLRRSLTLFESTGVFS